MGNCAVCNEKLNVNERFCRNCGNKKEISEPLLVLDIGEKQQNLINKRSAFTITELLIIVFILGIITAIAIPNYRKCYRAQSGKKACFSNMRVLLGAIEMYNMDHTSRFRYLDPADYGAGGRLVKGGYLRSPISLPQSDCKYFISGDLTKDGYIFCQKHGSIEGEAESREPKDE